MTDVDQTQTLNSIATLNTLISTTTDPVAIAAFQSQISDLQALLTPVKPPVPCGTCNRPTNCPTCDNPLGPDGFAPEGTVNTVTPDSS